MVKKVTTKNGRELTYENGKLVANEAVTETVSGNKCVVCQEQAKFTRFYNGDIWNVCEDCYYHKSLGKIAEAVRSKDGREEIH